MKFCTSDSVASFQLNKKTRRSIQHRKSELLMFSTALSCDEDNSSRWLHYQRSKRCYYAISKNLNIASPLFQHLSDLPRFYTTSWQTPPAPTSGTSTTLLSLLWRHFRFMCRAISALTYASGVSTSTSHDLCWSRRFMQCQPQTMRI
jgi:hypothetical protein